MPFGRRCVARHAPAEPADRRERHRDFYPTDATDRDDARLRRSPDRLPVQFVKGLQTLYAAGARVVEVGPKKALHGFAEDVLASRYDDVVTLFTNPKLADEVGVNQALCGLWAAGLGFAEPAAAPAAVAAPAPAPAVAPASAPAAPAVQAAPTGSRGSGPITLPEVTVSDETITELGRLFAGVLEEGMRLYRGDSGAASAAPAAGSRRPDPTPAPAAPKPGAGLASTAPVVITGAALGLPGVERTFDDENIARILAGQSFIETIPQGVRDRMVDMRITRIVKDATTGSGSSSPSTTPPTSSARGPARTARHGRPVRLDRAWTRRWTTTRLAIGAGFDACVTGSADAALQDDDDRIPAARHMGLPEGCATTRASSSPVPSPGTTASPRRSRSMRSTAAAGRTSPRCRACVPR